MFLSHKWNEHELPVLRLERIFLTRFESDPM